MVQMITVKNNGPAPLATIPIPEEGGVVLLRGPNGCGKSETLKAVRSLISGEGKLSVRDGAPRAEVEGLGVKVTYARSTRRTGELEALSLENRLDIGDLIDPDIVDPLAADAKRIKKLVQLSGIKADHNRFREQVGGETFDSIVSPESLETEDLVLMASRIKRDIEAEARKEEKQVEKLEAEIAANRKLAEGSEEVEHNAELLQNRLEAAIKADSEITTRVEMAEDAAKRSAEAARELARVEASSVVSIKDAEEKHAVAAKVRQIAQQEVDACSAALEKARGQLLNTIHAERLAESELKSAQNHEATLVNCRKAIEESNGITCPTPDEVATSNIEISRCRKAIEEGAARRQALAAIANAEKLTKESKAVAKRAEMLRDAARNTDLVLSDAICSHGGPLRVEAGRLVLTTRRGTTFYGDLSHGERSRVAIDIGIGVVKSLQEDGQMGILTADQEIWEGLDPQNRHEIKESLEGTGVVFISCQATSGDELTAKRFM